VAPEVLIGLPLGDPVLIHVRKQVQLPERLKEGAYTRPLVGWDRNA